MKKRITSLVLALAMLCSLAMTSASFALDIDTEYTEAANEKLDAPYEDALLELWFDHSFTKVSQDDIEPSGLYTYTVKMAKNEIENCQFFLASYCGHEGLSVEVSDFVGPATLPTELFYEHYIRMGDNGMLPDPIIPFGESIDIEMNKSQGFIVKVKTTADTPAGSYKATVNVKDSAGDIIKTAEISLEVWDFVLSEETAIDTAFGLGRYGIYTEHGMYGGDDGTLYKTYYDFLLENRICAYDLPYDITDPRADEYLNNPRVTSFHIDGYGKSLSDDEIEAVYNKLSANDEWFDKGFFYYVDEPSSEAHINSIKAAGERLAEIYPDYQMISPYFLNYEFGGKDMISLMEPYINIWCTKLNAWTPQGATGDGVIHMLTDEQIKKDGTYAERMAEQVAGGDKNWDYLCWEPIEPYVMFDAAHQGIEQRIAFWQSYDLDVTGLLYFAVNEWSGGTHWTNIEKINAGGVPVYGDGTLIYCGEYLPRLGEEKIAGPVSSLRLENVRDGIEDYQYLYMAEKLFGSEVVDEYIAQITTDVITWTKDDDVMQNTRCALGDLIETKTPKAYPESIQFTAASGITTYGEAKQISGIPAKTTVAALKSALVNSTGISVYKPNGMAVLAEDAYVTNGCIVRLFDEYGLLLDEATVVFMGDANGDGNISTTDAIEIIKYNAQWKVSIDLAASDVNGDGKCNTTDAVSIIRYLANWKIEFALPAEKSYEIVGSFDQLTYTDSADGSGIDVPTPILDSSLAVSFNVKFGSWLDSITVPYMADSNGSYTLELYKTNGGADSDPVAKVSGKVTASDAEQKIELALSELKLGAGRYVFILTGDGGFNPIQRNALVGDDGWSFLVDGEVQDEFSVEAVITVSYCDRFDLSEDTNVSSMVKPLYTTVAIPGLKESYTFLHVTDAHFALYYEDEFTGGTAEKRTQYAIERDAGFTAATGINSADRFPYLMDYAASVGAEQIFATGDMIDFPSTANLDAMFAEDLMSSGIDFTYCLGNHDWSFNDNYVTDYARENYADKLFVDYLGEDSYFQAKEFDEFIIVAMDNSLDTYTDDQLVKLRAEAAKGKPIILLAHVPFTSPTLTEAVKSAWGRNITLGPDTDINYSAATKAMYEFVSSEESNVAAIFTGHVHFNHEDLVGGRVPQYVTGAAYEGYARVVTLAPAAQ